MNQISLSRASSLLFVVVIASVLAFTTKPITIYVKKPIKDIRGQIGKGFHVPVFDEDDEAGKATDDAQTGGNTTGDQAATGQSQGWTWSSFGTSVGTGAVAGAIGGAAGGAVAGSLAGGVGAGPGAVAGGVAGGVAGAVGGAVKYAWTYFGGSIEFVNIYVLPEMALDFNKQINQGKQIGH